MPHGNQKVSDERILGVFEESDDPVLAAKEIAQRVPLTRQGALTRLVDLAEKNEVDRKKTGRDVVWWRTND